MKLFRRLSTVYLVSKVYTLVKVLTMVYVERVNLTIIHYYSMATSVLLLCYYCAAVNPFLAQAKVRCPWGKQEIFMTI